MKACMVDKRLPCNGGVVDCSLTSHKPDPGQLSLQESQASNCVNLNLTLSKVNFKCIIVPCICRILVNNFTSSEMEVNFVFSGFCINYKVYYSGMPETNKKKRLKFVELLLRTGSSGLISYGHVKQQ